MTDERPENLEGIVSDASEGDLRALGEHDIDSWRRENIRRRAHHALDGGPGDKFAIAYRRFLEPALVATVCVVHLAWAFGTTASLLLR